MAKFEYKTHGSGDHVPPQTIEADDYVLDTKNGNLTFTDENNEQLASFSTQVGAWVKRVSK